MAGRRLPGVRIAAGMLIALAALSVASCRSQYVQEPWMGGAGEKAKQAWVSSPSPQLLDQLRNRLATSQTDR